jgi:hypothetical protein
MKLNIDRIIPSIRNAASVIVATVILLFISYFTAIQIRSRLISGADIISIFGILLIYIFMGGSITYLFCMVTHYIFSYWKKVHLTKAIRLSEAMQMIHAHMHHEKVDDIKRYSIQIYKSETALGAVSN